MNTTNTNIINDGRFENTTFEFYYIRNSYSNETYFDLVKNNIKQVNDLLLDNVFYYAVDKVEQSSMFSWAYTSFLVAPFQYILALFGVPSTHVIVELLSYWLSVSVIWLIFDVIMYVPLLAHRWLDKGVIE